MDISLIVDILILAALLYVAYKLHAIALTLSRVLEAASRDRDARDSSPSAQTINVNVAPAPGSAIAGASAIIPVAAPAQGLQEVADRAGVSSGMDRPSADLSAAEPSRTEKKSAASGPFSVQCSRCHAENSSYRTECFNCGNPL